jgi:hypothetical protein
MQLTYTYYYRKFGIRRVNQLISPPMPRVELLDLPRNAVLHYVGAGPLDDGPTEEENILTNCKRGILIETVPELINPLGSPRKSQINPERLARVHRMRHPRFRPFRGFAIADRDPTMPVVVNYSYLIRTYKYTKNVYLTYYQHVNILHTVFERMTQIAQETERNQFVEFNLPKVIPSVSMLLMAERHISTKLSMQFSTIEMLAILELWKWFGPNRGETIFAKIPKDRLERINIIFKDADRWIVFNLNTLEQWRHASKKEIEENEEANEVGFDPVQFQKRFLRLLISLSTARTEVVPENLGDETEVVDVKNATQPITEDTTSPATNSGSQGVPSEQQVENGAQTSPSNTATTAAELKKQKQEEIKETIEKQTGYKTPVVSTSKALDVNEELLRMPTIDQLEADLSVLEEINKRAQEIQEVVADDDIRHVPVENKLKPLDEALRDVCHKLVDDDGITASEYRRYLELAETYKKIQAPDGTTLGEFVEIPKEKIKITKTPVMADSASVIDKSMLESSLNVFDKKYVEEVMPRDIASMVTNLQRAGVIILDYKVETISEITGSYDSYSVRVKPVQGATSTLRFKLPKVNSDGSYMINGVTYRTRKQRSDLPIRKIRPTRVALTSYYGKTFVDRDEKKVNDYGRWLREMIMSVGLADDQTLLSNVIPGDCFYTDFKAPRLYTTIAMGFRSFTIKVKNSEGGEKLWNMVFDAKQRETVFTPEQIKNIESKNLIIVGESQGSIMAMAFDDSLYEIKPDGNTNALIALPSFESMLGLSLSKAPLEFTTLNVSGTPVPVAFVLSYLMGLDNLIKRLRINYTIVPGGQRAVVQDDEWAIHFQDETWVFDRSNRLASMILAGWKTFDSTTRIYNSVEFNRRDVYFNVLDDQNMGVRFLREIDLMNQLFVDPITKELLEEMKEPTVFTDLIIRGCEYLTTDDHPHELDMNQMRIKGYERFAGFVYSELVRSLRAHNARSNKNMYPIELNPYAVWFAVCEDPAKNQNSEINPIQNLKELEAVTYSGTGGRSGRTMVKRTRAYHKSDMGVISEATMDSSDVGINTFLSANPKFNSLRGTADPYVVGKDSATSLLSTSLMLAPGADRDA